MQTIRQDLQLQAHAIEHGFKVERHPDDVDRQTPCHPLRFSLGSHHVWFCRKGWAVADLVGDHYVNHAYHEDLMVSLNQAERRAGNV